MARSPQKEHVTRAHRPITGLEVVHSTIRTSTINKIPCHSRIQKTEMPIRGTGTSPMEIQIRHGQMGQAGSTWDNGFYAKVDAAGVGIEYLIDNGSTMTLILKVAFDRLPAEKQSTTSTEILKVRDANDNLIKTYGNLEVPINLMDF